VRRGARSRSAKKGRDARPEARPIPNGVFELNTLIDMYMVTIRGNILDGVLRLTTMFVAHSH
jgi:hypothetical protein